ncbi:MAG: FeoB-associated Cys-rich membrane protein [bacterium]|nr:FeoB-associated Cys-rich membrane protein [bacterium]
MFGYIIFALIILLAVVIIARKIYKIIKGKGSACSCCADKGKCSSIKKQ